MYACDCDGVTRDGSVDHGVEGDHLRRHLTMIEQVTGHRPPTCPWNAFNEPIVKEVLKHTWSVTDGNLTVSMGADPSNIVSEAMGVYIRARGAARAEEDRAQREDAKVERAAKAALAKASRG